MEPLRKALRLPRVEPVHRRRHRSRQDDRGGADRPGAAAAQEGEDDRRRRAAVGARAVEGRARRAVRAACSRSSTATTSPRVRRERGFGVNPWRDAQPLPRLPQPARRPDLRRPDARVARAAAAGEPADPRRGPSRRAVERRALRDRDEVHARRPRSRRPLRAPAVPLGDAAQRPFEQLLDAARAARPLPLHPRRQGPRQEGARGRDGPPAQGGHPRDPGRLPEADHRARRDRRPARRRPRACALAPARRVPHRPGDALREHVQPHPGRRPGCSSSGCSSACSHRSRRSPAASRSTAGPSSASGQQAAASRRRRTPTRSTARPRS